MSFRSEWNKSYINKIILIKRRSNIMSNMPEVKVGVVAVSRDCFPESLSVTRRANLMKAYTEKYGAEGIYECPACKAF